LSEHGNFPDLHGGAGEEAGKKEIQRRQSMMLSVLAVLVLVAVGPIALMAYKITSELKGDLIANQKELQLEKATSIQEDLAAQIESRFQLLHLIGEAAASSVAAGSERGLGSDEALSDLRSLLERYLDQGGLQLVSLAPADLGLPPVTVHHPSFDREAADAQLKPLFARALEKGRNGTEFLSDPVLPRQGGALQPLAVLSVPIGSQSSRGARSAVLSAVVNLAGVQRLVQAEGDAEMGYTVFVLDSAGRPFAHTKFLEVVEQRDYSSSPLVQEFSRAGLAASSLEFETVESGQRTEMIGAYAPILLKDHRWGVFLQVDRAFGLAQVTELRKQALQWGLAAFGLALITGVAFSMRLTGPIRALTETTRRIAGGDYGRRVHVTQNNEIGMLADNFNLMTEEIRRTVDGLHRQRELNEQLFISSIRSLAAAIDARDPYTRGHSERVTRFARIIAQEMKLPSLRLRNIEIGALLHDVGKIGIEDRILRKPSALTPEEFEIMKTHPEKGGDIMEPISYMREATEIIVHHHERWDGTGYPSGLKAEDIPLGARVVAVADTFDAMTTNRPYQRAMTFEIAAKKIKSFSGKACDPAVVVAFLAAMEAGHFDLANRQESQAG
jgi:HD-GYP domain-containing protein (c-di-GMP phosphodiesterase class II)